MIVLTIILGIMVVILGYTTFNLLRKKRKTRGYPYRVYDLFK
jgi:hypothetical protein